MIKDIRTLLEHIDAASQEPVDEAEHAQQVSAVAITAGNNTMYFPAEALVDALVDFVETAVRNYDAAPHEAMEYQKLVRQARNAATAGRDLSIGLRMVDNDFFDSEDDEDYV